MNVNGSTSIGTDYSNASTPSSQPNSNVSVNTQNIESVSIESKDNSMMQDISERTRRNPAYRPSISEQAVLSAIEKANKKLMGAQAEFEFSVHEATKQIMVKVKNKETGEIIREIPPEKTLDIVAKMWELAGIMVDERR